MAKKLKLKNKLIDKGKGDESFEAFVAYMEELFAEADRMLNKGKDEEASRRTVRNQDAGQPGEVS